MSLSPGQSLAHYRIDRKIGEGGMGEVWAATDTRLNRVAALSHPNIAAVHGLEQVGDTPYLVLEMVEGEDLLLWVRDLASERPRPLVGTAGAQQPFWSPDGRWLAYQSSESGRLEIYVTAFPDGGGKWQLSNDGGSMPVWRADGRELFYLEADGMMAVPVDTTEGFRHDPPVNLFAAETSRTQYGSHTYDVTPDGQRFLFLAPVEDAAGETASVTLVQNWRLLLE